MTGLSTNSFYMVDAYRVKKHVKTCKKELLQITFFTRFFQICDFFILFPNNASLSYTESKPQKAERKNRIKRELRVCFFKNMSNVRLEVLKKIYLKSIS